MSAWEMLDVMKPWQTVSMTLVVITVNAGMVTLEMVLLALILMSV